MTTTPRTAPPFDDQTVDAPASGPTSALPPDTRSLLRSHRLAPGVIGARLRSRRLALGISLRQFARDVDVSASFISQLETGKAQPSVATFYSICSALGLTIDELFASEDAMSSSQADNRRRQSASRPITDDGVATASAANRSLVVRPHERTSLVLDSGVTWEALTSAHSDKADFMFVRYEVGGSSTMEGRFIRHVGTEYGFVLKGSLEIVVGFETFVMGPGDAISFDSSRPHRFTNVGLEPVEAVWMNIAFQGEDA